MCSFTGCYKRYKNLNGIKYHLEKNHNADKLQANQIASAIVKKTNAEYGISTRSVPTSVLAAAIRRQDPPHHDIPKPTAPPHYAHHSHPSLPAPTPSKPIVNFSAIVPALRTLLMGAALRANNPLITPTVITRALGIVDTGKLDPGLSQSAATTQMLSQVMATISSHTRIPVQDLIQQLSFKPTANGSNASANSSNGNTSTGMGGSGKEVGVSVSGKNVTK